ncbi:MAG: DUF3617 family protein [Betaproteobacteria bacterium]|nr:DUF3617 family protein [Betaproteobacteria bacterium]
MTVIDESRRNRTRILAVLGLAALGAWPAITAARGDPYPAFRAGLWEYTRSSANAPPGAPKFSTRECDDPHKAMIEQARNLEKRGCRLTPPRRKGKTWSFSAVCEVPGAGSTTSRTLLMRESDSAYTVMLETHGNMGGKPVDASDVVTARRLGDCPKQ